MRRVLLGQGSVQWRRDLEQKISLCGTAIRFQLDER
jgi:hypothetical protein